MKIAQISLFLGFLGMLFALGTPAHAQWTYTGSTFSSLVNNSDPPTNATQNATTTPTAGNPGTNVSLQVNASGNAAGRGTDSSAEYNFDTQQMFQWQNAGPPTETATVTETDTLSATASISNSGGHAGASVGSDNTPHQDEAAVASVPAGGYSKPGPFTDTYTRTASPDGSFSFTLSSEMDGSAGGAGGGSFTFTSQSNGSSAFAVQ